MVASDVRLERVEKRFGAVAAVRGVDLEIAHGEFVTLLGASGCGKTTTLRMVAGFVFPTSGEIYIGDQKVTRLPPYRRSTGMVFQSYAIFPHLTVGENVAFGLEVRRVPKAERRERVMAVLDLVRLGGLAERRPASLSGGQRQRVALARAVVIQPRVLLLDEPLGALDLKLREEMQLEIKRIQQELRITTLYVTHDQQEALSMSDRVAVMKDGRILQVDAPRRLYDAPRSKYVATFVGRMNCLRVFVSEPNSGSGTALVRRRADPTVAFAVSVDPGLALRAGDECLLAFRPEHALLDPPEPATVVDGSLQKIAYLGNSSLWFVETADKDVLVIEVAPGRGARSPGAPVRVGWRPESCVLLKDDT